MKSCIIRIILYTWRYRVERINAGNNDDGDDYDHDGDETEEGNGVTSAGENSNSLAHVTSR